MAVNWISHGERSTRGILVPLKMVMKSNCFGQTLAHAANIIAAFIKPYLFRVYSPHRALTLRLRLIQTGKETSWVTASLMLHGFRSSVMDARLKWSWADKPILTNTHFPVICWDTVTGYKRTVENKPLPLTKLPLSMGSGSDVIVYGTRETTSIHSWHVPLFHCFDASAVPPLSLTLYVYFPLLFFYPGVTAKLLSHSKDQSSFIVSENGILQ